jgi:propanediol utilization protein
VQYQPANLIGMPSGVSAGTIVRVKGSLLNPTTIIANKVRQVGLTAALKENQYVELEGVVTSFTSATNFEINGLKVSVAASGTIEGTPAPGSRAQVEGTVANGILVASRVQIQDENQPQPDANEVHAQISSIDNANKILTVRNGTITIRWDNNTVFDSSLPNGAGSLTVGLQIDVDGKMTGNELLASQIGLDTQ